MGPLRKMQMVSNNIGCGTCLAPNDEVEQHISLSADGEVNFSAFCYGSGEPYKKVWNGNCFIPPELAQSILALIAE